MPEESNRRVIQATWNWRAGQDPGSGRATAGLRRQAVIQALVMAAVAAFLHFVLHHALFVPFILGLAAVVLVLGLAYPPAYRPVHAFGRWLGRIVGRGFTLVLLVPFFFLFFTPVALILRSQGRDPLHRRFRDSQWTYWIRRPAKGPADNIDKQFLREDRDTRGELRAVGTPGDPKGPVRS